MGKQGSMHGGGPLAEFEAGYRAELVSNGYRPSTVVILIGLMRRLSGWMEVSGRAAGGLSCEVAETFLEEMNAQGRVVRPTLATLDSLLVYLRRLGVVPAAFVTEPWEGGDEVVEAFCSYLIDERGLVPETVKNYARSATAFLGWQRDGGLVDLAGLNARDVVAFATAECPRCSTGTAKLMLTGVRSFLRFAHLEGLVPVSLVGAVPPVAGWSLATLPQGLTGPEVRLLLASCDRRGVKGRRNYAILLLLVRFGLRAGEVAALQLDDVDWRAGEVVIRGKGNHDERLPLPADVGEAIAGYLRYGRPKGSLHRAMFLRVQAPIGPLQPGGVAEVVAASCRRAGVSVVGPHRLRHTAATEMLRNGAALSEVAQVLRHRSVATTAMYAKVDHLALVELAIVWPEGGAR